MKSLKGYDFYVKLIGLTRKMLTRKVNFNSDVPIFNNVDLGYFLE